MNINWKSYSSDLASSYDTLKRMKQEKQFVHSRVVSPGQCSAAAEEFMNDEIFIKISSL